MAITYVGGVANGRAGNTGSTTQSITGLTGGSAAAPTAGDFMVVTVVTGTTTDRRPSTTPTLPVTAQTDLAQLVADDTNDTSLSVSYGFYSAGTTVTIPATGNAADAQRWQIQVFRGVDPTTPMDVAAVSATGVNTSRANPPSITPTTSGAWVVICTGGAAGTATAFTFGTLTNVIGAASTDTVDAVGASGYTTWGGGAVDIAVSSTGSATTSDSWAAYALALRPYVPPLVETLTEDFDAALDSGVWTMTTPGSTTQSVTGGRLEQDGGATTSYPDTTSVSTYDLTGSSAYARFVRPVQGVSGVGTGYESTFRLWVDSGNWIDWMWYTDGSTNGAVRARYLKASSFTDFGGTAYSSTNHAWFRIRESAGTVYWDVAPSSSTNPPSSGDWTNINSATLATLGFAVTGVKVVFNTGRWTDPGTLSTGPAQWDGLNTGENSAGTDVALTGHGLTVGREAVGITHASPLTGIGLTAANEALGVEREHPLTGHDLTVTGDTLTPFVGIDVALTGLGLTAANEAMGVTRESALTGHDLTVAADDTVAALALSLTGHELTVAGDTLTPGSEMSAALVGHEMAVDSGAFGVEHTLALIGHEMTASRGSFGSFSNTIDLLTETFNGSIDTGKWSATVPSGTNQTFTDGVMEQSNASATAYCALVSVDSYDLTSSAAYVRFVQPFQGLSGVGTGYEAAFRLELDASNYIDFMWVTSGSTNGSMLARHLSGGWYTDVLFSGYTAADFAWLRIRESGGTVYWDRAPSTASDPPTSGQWVNFTSTALTSIGFAITDLKVAFSSGRWVNPGTGPTGPVKWDGLNTNTGALVTLTGHLMSVGRGTLTPSDGSILISTLTETFDSALDSAKWGTRVSQVGDSVTASSGELDIDVNGAVGGQYAELFSQNTYNMTGSSAYVKLAQPLKSPTTTAGTEQYFMVEFGANADGSSNGWNVAWYLQTNGTFHTNLRENWVTLEPATTYVTFNYYTDAATHTWLRIRESGGTFYWDTAPSTASNPPTEGQWVNRHSHVLSGSTPLTTARIKLGVGSWDGPSAGVPSQNARFDGVNTAAGTPSVALVGHVMVISRGNFNGISRRPTVIDSSWTERYYRDYAASNAVSLSSATDGTTLIADKGELGPCAARYREWWKFGIGHGNTYDVYTDPFHSTLPAEYIIARPLGEFEPIPGVGLRCYSRTSTGPDMDTALASQFNYVVSYCAANGVAPRLGAYLLSYRKVAAKPPFARFTYFIHRQDPAATRSWPGIMWSTEEENREWPNDTLHKPFEYDDQEFLGRGTNQRASSTSLHVYGTTGFSNQVFSGTVGDYNVDQTNALIGVCTVFDTTTIKTYYNMNGGAWTQVSSVTVATTLANSEYDQYHMGFIHNYQAGWPWLGASGVPLSTNMSYDIVATGLYAPASNTDVVVPSGTPPEEVTLAWRGSYDSGIPASTPVGTVVADLVFSDGVTSANTITYNDNLTVVGTELQVSNTLNATIQPVLRFHIQGVKADGTKSIGRLYSISTTGTGATLTGRGVAVVRGSLTPVVSVALTGHAIGAHSGSLDTPSDVFVALSGHSMSVSRGIMGQQPTLWGATETTATGAWTRTDSPQAPAWTQTSTTQAPGWTRTGT